MTINKAPRIEQNEISHLTLFWYKSHRCYANTEFTSHHTPIIAEILHIACYCR